MKKGRLALLILLLFPAAAAADEIDLGKQMQEQGDYKTAAAHFASWLEKNPDHENFSDILQLYLDSVENINSAVSFLEDLLKEDEASGNKGIISLNLAFLLELSGKIQNAQQTFEIANFSTTNRHDLDNFFQSIRLLIDMGEFQRAKAQTNALITTGSDPKLIAEGRMYLAYIEYLLKDAAGAKDSIILAAENIEESTVEQIYNIYNIAKLLKLESLAEKCAAAMEEKYPESPEAGQIVSGMPVSFIPTMHFFETATMELSFSDNSILTDEVIRIQTGVFSKLENAENQVKELSMEGFSMEVVPFESNGETFYRVISDGLPESEVQKSVLMLKEKGIEAFLHFP